MKEEVEIDLDQDKEGKNPATKHLKKSKKDRG